LIDLSEAVRKECYNSSKKTKTPVCCQHLFSVLDVFGSVNCLCGFLNWRGYGAMFRAGHERIGEFRQSTCPALLLGSGQNVTTNAIYKDDGIQGFGDTGSEHKDAE